MVYAANKSAFSKSFRAGWAICIGLSVMAFHISSGRAQAPTAPITSSGLNTQISDPIVTAGGKSQYDITGGTRAGSNVFHSFGDFTVPSNHTANFLNITGQVTTNILARVTGGNPSNILGTIQTAGFGNANLFLMNPSGITFGPNASLNVGGSVTFTTADYLRLTDNRRFNAIPNPSIDALLSTKPVEAYGFLGSSPGAITVQGSQLGVTNGQGISLVGGNIAIQNGTLENGTIQPARFSAPSGQINLATAKSPGEFLQDLTIAPNINGALFRSFGSAHFASGSTVDVSRTGNGKVSIRSGQLVLEVHNAALDTASNSVSSAVTPDKDTIILAAKSSLLSQTSSADMGPDVHITADRITILGIPGSSPENQQNTNIRSETHGAGNSGNITFRAMNNIEITNLVNLSSFSKLTGDAGNVELSSTHGDIRITESMDTAVASKTFASGKTGKVSILAPEGDIVLDGGNIFTSASPASRGGGQVEVSAKNLHMKNVALLANDNESLLKPDGITVTLSEKLMMEGGSLIVTSSINNAPSAEINITARDVIVTQGSIINSDAFESGPGGQLRIATDTLEILDGGQISSGSRKAPDRGSLPQSLIPSGMGGNITVEALGTRGSILIDGAGSRISADTEGTGVGGTINLAARILTIQNSGTISASTTGTDPRAIGGSILLNLTDHVTLTNDASITASTSGPGNAGNILVRTNGVAISGGSNITASSTGTGNAGTVRIQGLQSPAHSLLIDGVKSGIFTKTGNTGAGGDITVSSNSVRMQNQGSISGETSGTAETATGGKIRVEGDTIRIENGALMTSSSTGAGSGGNIKLTAGQSVSIFDGASISASSTGTGAAGNIEIDAGLELDVQRGSITTQSTELSGGNIAIRAIDLLRVVEGKISTSAINGGGNGGAITIDPKVVLLQNSDILAQANRGVGGDISITTPVFIADQSSRVDASTPFGLNGRITIQSPTSNLSGTVGQLASKTSPPQVLLQNRCVALAGGEQSTFLLAGRDALPIEPNGWLSSPVSMEHWTGEDTAHASRLMARNQNVDSSPVIAAHSNKSRVLSLRRLTPPGFLVRTFATEATGCPS